MKGHESNQKNCALTRVIFQRTFWQNTRKQNKKSKIISIKMVQFSSDYFFTTSISQRFRLSHWLLGWDRSFRQRTICREIGVSDRFLFPEMFAAVLNTLKNYKKWSLKYHHHHFFRHHFFSFATAFSNYSVTIQVRQASFFHYIFFSLQFLKSFYLCHTR